MAQKILIALAFTSALLSPLAAHAEVQTGDVVGSSEAEIIATLEAKGFTVEEIETEDGEIEIEAMLNGKEMEIEVAADTGAITEVETVDDSDEDDDDKDESDKG